MRRCRARSGVYLYETPPQAHYAEGKVVTLLSRAADRVDALCPHCMAYAAVAVFSMWNHPHKSESSKIYSLKQFKTRSARLRCLNCGSHWKARIGVIARKARMGR